MLKRLWAFSRREPLVHFMALAALLFLVNAAWPGGQEVILVDRATQDFLIKQQADLLLRPLTPEEVDLMIAGYIEEEILLREAYRRGLDKTARIRRQLVQNMRFLLSRDVQKPTAEELRTFFEQEKSRFETPPTLTLDHVLFSDPRRVPEGTLVGLRDGLDHRSLGHFNMNLGRRIPRAGQRQLVQIFGPAAARGILDIEDDDWHGPFLSSRGAHFLRITERHPARLPSFDAAASFLEGEWLLGKQREILDRESEALRQNYRIVVEERKPKASD